MRFKGGFLLPFLVLPFVSGCMGGGGGSSSPGPYEIAYILSENSSTGKGAVVEYALNPTNGSLYSGSQTVPTNGFVPISFLMAPGNSTAFVLNNNSPSTPNPGSVASYTISSTGLSGPNPSTPVSTGPNPVNMAIDPGGKYLVVANHGTGTSTNPTGSVQVFSFSASGTLSQVGTLSAGSPCDYPFRVVFGPNSSGSTSDTVYVACTSPELLRSTPPAVQIYQCTIANLSINSCPSTSSFTMPSLPSSSVLVTMALDPSGKYLVAPGASTSTGFLLVCALASTSCSNAGNFPSLITLPSSNIAFSGSGSSEEVYIGNYNSTSTSTMNGDFASCTLSSPSCTEQTTLSHAGPIAFATNNDGSTLYIADTTSVAVPQNLQTISSSTPPTTPSTGYLYTCPISSSITCSASPATVGYWPVNISLDPSGNFLFVPTLSGSVSVFQVASSGTLTPLSGSTMSVSSPLVPFSVTVPPNP